MRPTEQTLRGAYFIAKTKGVVFHDTLRSLIMYDLPFDSRIFDIYLIIFQPNVQHQIVLPSIV